MGLSQPEIDALTDADYVRRLAECYWLEEQAAEAVKRGVLMALAEAFRRK